jgi:hypothetical protein
MKLVNLTITEPIVNMATGGGFDPDADFDKVGAKGASTTAAATAADFSAGAFGGDLGVASASIVPKRASSLSFGGEMYGMSSSGVRKLHNVQR